VPADHLRAALASCDRHSADHCHGYAVVLAMARLALRAGEVAGLRRAGLWWLRRPEPTAARSRWWQGPEAR
jgi:hypothetical protein